MMKSATIKKQALSLTSATRFILGTPSSSSASEMAEVRDNAKKQEFPDPGRCLFAASLKRAVDVRCRKGHLIPRHQHWDYEFICIIEGTYTCEHNQVRHELKPGMSLLVRPGDWHTDHFPEECRYGAVNFLIVPVNQNQRIPDFFAGIPDENLLRIQNDPEKLLLRTFQQIHKEARRAERFSPFLRDTLTLELFWRIAEKIPGTADTCNLDNSSPHAEFRYRLNLLFQEHLHDWLSLEQMADCMHVSIRTLSGRCGSLLGCSPIKALTGLKMEHALRMLERTEMSIKEISDYLGFQNPYHFSTVFKRYFRHSPTVARSRRPLRNG